MHITKWVKLRFGGAVETPGWWSRCLAPCERPMPLTFHHLTPKSTHADMLKRGLCAKEDLTRGPPRPPLWVCGENDLIFFSFVNNFLQFFSFFLFPFFLISPLPPICFISPEHFFCIRGVIFKCDYLLLHELTKHQTTSSHVTTFAGSLQDIRHNSGFLFRRDTCLGGLFLGGGFGNDLPQILTPLFIVNRFLLPIDIMGSGPNLR